MLSENVIAIIRTEMGRHKFDTYRCYRPCQPPPRLIWLGAVAVRQHRAVPPKFAYSPVPITATLRSAGAAAMYCCVLAKASRYCSSFTMAYRRNIESVLCPVTTPSQN